MSARTNLAILGIALAFGVAGFGASRWLFAPAAIRTATPFVTIGVGEPYRDVVLPDLDERPRRLSEWDGRVRLLNYWATWCAPCVREMPLLEAYARAHPEVAVVGIALDDPDVARDFVANVGVSYPILAEIPSATDSSVMFGNARGVLPYSVLIDADGVVRAAVTGDFDDAAEIDAFVARSNAR